MEEKDSILVTLRAVSIGEEVYLLSIQINTRNPKHNQMKTILFLLLMVIISSCSITNNLSDAEYMHRARIQKQIDVLQADYHYTLDSLYIEYYKTEIK